jgi:two-component system OmpR family sensor kinase
VNEAGTSWRALATTLPGVGTLIVAVPLSETTATLRQLLGVELAASAIVLAAVIGLALWLVRLGLKPLEDMGLTADAIAAGDLTRRVEPANPRTEVGRLGMALNGMLSQIEAAFEQRTKSEDRLRRFVADASHELRTPLTSIRGYAELFRRGAGQRPEDLERSMAAIEAEASRMGVLVEDLLLLARLDQGRPLEIARVDLGAIATEAVEAARAIDPGRDVSLEVDGDVSIDGDAGRLRQVLDNLLDNARVHTPAGTPARVRVARDGEAVVLTVDDEGPGLTPEAHERVFERFYRDDGARSRETGGAGLGLAIVDAITTAHGGEVRALDVVEGASFEVRIPAHLADVAS